MEDEIDSAIRKRTAQLEHEVALLKAEIEVRKKAQAYCHEQLTKLQLAEIQSDRGNTVTDHISAVPLTQQEVLQMKLKDFCDTNIEPVYGSRFWRYVVNSKKAFEPLCPMHELMDITVQDFSDDIKCKMRIIKNYNNETLCKAVNAFARFQIFPFGTIE